MTPSLLYISLTGEINVPGEYLWQGKATFDIQWAI